MHKTMILKLIQRTGEIIMGWFGVIETNKQDAFNELFSQKQYRQKFELLWYRHAGNKSFAVYTLDGKYVGETILWADDDGEIMYKPISWTDGAAYFPKKWINKLLQNASDFEIECYNEFLAKQNQKMNARNG